MGINPGKEFIQFSHHGKLPGRYLVLNQLHPGVFPVNQNGFQTIIPIKRFPGQDMHGNLHHLVTARWIQISGRKYTINHILDTVGKGVNPEERNSGRVREHLIGTAGHPVVLGKDGIESDSLIQKRLHRSGSAFLQPSAIA